ncbi:MAG: DEAD/DEAH box helicase, partial [Deltaproteobacteria bacterium]|nr:DEAD/DEAH box helicase [Deltaproteobacteria bacterium]
MALTALHPAVRGWFTEVLGAPTPVQARAIPVIGAGGDTLVAAPTGAGKTLAAFLSAIDGMVREGAGLPDEARVLYVSPLRALSNDIRQNLELPLAGIAARVPAEERRELRVLVRTGDTRAADRARMRTRAPHIVVTTPESLYILLTSESGRAMLRTVRTVIVDEIHAVAGVRRGAHLALSLERLDALAGRRVQRIGLSATQRPLDAVARLLVGRGPGGEPLPCAVIDEGHRRPADLAIELPAAPLEAVLSHDGWSRVHDRIAALAGQHRTTLVFTGTRRMAERLTAALGERLGADQVATHHGSLSRESRERAERRLKSGELRLLVATASLELGIDIGSVDLVCQVGSPRSFSAFLQRAGRSGHRAGERSKALLFPLSRDDLVECVALLDGTRAGELDRLRIPEGGLDVLAQQVVATVATGEWSEDALFDRLRRAEPYAALERDRFDAVVALVAEGYATRRGKTQARVHRDATTGTLRPRRGTRLVAVTSGGAIPDTADYEVRLEPDGIRVGTLHEDFAIESSAGDVFQLGNSSWKILRVESSIVRVEDARGSPPTVPFWLGEAPSRTPELSARVSALRARVDAWLEAESGDAERVAARAADELALVPAVARELTEYLAAGRATLGAMPTAKNLVIERFFDDSGGMQLVVHSPRGAAVNRALGLALRKRFCQRFDFELQAAATDDAVVLSLGHTHSFPLEEVFGYLRSGTVRGV